MASRKWMSYPIAMKHAFRSAVLVTALCGVLPATAQTNGVWRDGDDLLALGGYEPDVVGGYWDAGYEFDFTLFCSPTQRGLNLGFGSANTQPSDDDQTFFVQLGNQRFFIPWVDNSSIGFVNAYYPEAPVAEPWPGQEDFIQRLIDGHALQVMEGASVDDPTAQVWRTAASVPGLALFQDLSRTCGSGVVTPQSEVAVIPRPDVTVSGPSTWILGAGTELWDGLTAYSPSDNDEAQGFVHCGADGQAEFVLRVTDVDAPTDTNFGSVHLGADTFEIVAGRLGAAYVFAAPPEMIGAMMTRSQMSVDSLIPVYETVDTVVTFNLHGAARVLEEALAPCAATALP